MADFGVAMEKGKETTRILVVEDSATQSRATRATLERYGWSVECVSNLQQTLERLQRSGIDAILLDLSLPDSSGLDTFEWVHNQNTSIPIVVFTAQDDKQLALEAVKHGAQDYVVKGLAGDDSLVRCLQYGIERSRAEVALRKSERRMRVILDNSYDAFISMDSNWWINDWNVQAEKTFGWDKSEALGQSLSAMIPQHLQKQYLGRIENYFNRNSGNVLRTSDELFALHRDGHEFPVEIGIFRIEEENDHSYCAFVRDITERRKSSEDLERLIQERTGKLTQSNEELRQFAKVASHDLQEPLRAVQGFANLLAENTQGKLDKDAQEFVEYILDGTKRMQHLIQAVLVHSQVSAEHSHEHATNCNAVIEDVLAALRISLEETEATLEVDKLPEVAVERSQLIQLFQNLISNAIKYRGPNPPKIYVTAERHVDQWMFTVRDNGIGIDPKYADKIFDMFARLHGKTQYPGTGMGLAICKRIVTSHGGNIWVESEPGHGSIFMFTLPAVRKEGEAK
jgi:PAS domain S-box-containing protein